MAQYYSHCRFCGEHKRISELMEWNLECFVEGTNLTKENLMKTDSIQWESSYLPETACITCCDKLEDAFEFFLKIQKAQSELTKLYSHNATLVYDNDVKLENNEDDLETDTQDTISDDQPLINELKFKVNVEKVDIEDVKQNDNKKIKVEGEIYKSDSNIDPIHTASKSSAKNSLSEIEMPMLVEHALSWNKYKWECCHCNFDFASMNEVRDHSKRVHSTCFGFKCADCNKLFNHFNIFVEHVREHRSGLRLHCQYCDQKFPTIEQCSTHSYTHWNTSIICERCGEILPDQTSMECHLVEFKKAALPKDRRMPAAVDVKNHSWAEYRWTCQDCSMVHPDVFSLRRHTRDVHRKCFSMKCVDCHTVMLHYRHFVQHAKAHRRFLDEYCFYCNMYCPTYEEERTHQTTHSIKKICDGCGEIFTEECQLDRHLKKYKVKRRPGQASAEDLTCTTCYKTFKCQSVLRTHQLIHGERKRNHICHICGKGFYNSYGLTTHVSLTHDDTEQVCETCNKVVPRSYYRVHLRGHLNVGKKNKIFFCDYCMKSFRSKAVLRTHLVIHTDTFPFKCEVCDKTFRLPKGLRLHSLQHSGEKPYKCEQCERAFTNWGNCNKHMIRMHGITLARTKLTDQGRVEIDRRTGDVQVRRELGEETKRNIEKILGSVRKGRPRLERHKNKPKPSS